jgi:uncharacterized protein (TIGR00730 family)
MAEHTPSLSLCVYCGSRPGTDPSYTRAARELGARLGERGWTLVYGGARVGLMGSVADATLAAGGRVIGVIPEVLTSREVAHHGLTELHVVQTMHQRKHLMAERADAFLALPGGVGTLEELFEAWTWRQLGYHHKPLALLNVAGYYDELLSFMRRSVAMDLTSSQTHGHLLVDTEVDGLLDQVAAQHPRP